MDLFLSHYVNRFDAKGRISAPAAFRAVLARDGFEGVLVHPALDAPALDCGGLALLREINALLDSLPPYSPQREDLPPRCSARARFCGPIRRGASC